ncbi:MAG: LytR C-terminal domain-containing protein [Gaiellales bacterium]
MSDEMVSSLATARTRRRLTVPEAAERAGLTPQAVTALEEGRLHRFPSLQEAVAATIVYSSALGIGQREARRLAGLPARPRLVEAWRVRRVVTAAAFATGAAALVWFVALPRIGDETAPSPSAAAAEPVLPAPELPAQWEIRVDVLNGSGADGAATLMANRVAALAYKIGEVTNAPRQDYATTRVYFPPGAEDVAERLADELGITTQELPGGDDPMQLYVIVGEQTPPAPTRPVAGREDPTGAA